MKLQTIKLSDAYESENNPRGNDFKGPAFDDLVASVKEKGVLVPVIIRPRKKGAKEYEIVAGNRRFRAAQLAGLKEIAARIEDLTDEQAQEVQIIENLQREDVHPLEEALAYVDLLKQIKKEGVDGIKEIAKRVAKSESYVRQRLYLTHLVKEGQQAFRKGEISATFAEMIGRLEEQDQKDCLEEIEDHRDYDPMDEKELREWIRTRTFQSLKAHQPWTNDAELLAAVGACVECPKQKQDLFGKNAEETCTDPRCYARKMSAYIELTKKKYADQGKTILLVSDSYGSNPGKGILKQNAYKRLDGKETCKFAADALIVEGNYRVGTIIRVCAARDCKKHRPEMGGLPESAEEKRKRQEKAEKEKAKEQQQKEKNDAAFLKALEKVKAPLGGKHLDLLLEITMPNAETENTARRLKLPSTGEDYAYGEAEKLIRAAMKKMTDTEKVRVLMDIAIEGLYGDKQKKAIGRL